MRESFILAVTNDEYEIPVMICETIVEMAEKLQVSKKGIWNHVNKRIQKPIGKYKFMKIDEITNELAIKLMDTETMALFLRMAGHHIGGWSYMELIDWLKEEDNISERLTGAAKEFYELHG